MARFVYTSAARMRAIEGPLLAMFDSTVPDWLGMRWVQFVAVQSLPDAYELLCDMRFGLGGQYSLTLRTHANTEIAVRVVTLSDGLTVRGHILTTSPNEEKAIDHV